MVLPGLRSVRSDAQANRARLLDAARMVFAEKGTGAEMKEIAERADLGIGTIYRNFATKDDLLAAIVGELIAGFTAVTDAAIEIADPEEAVRHYLTEVIKVIESRGRVVPALMAGGLPPAATQQFECVVGDTRMKDVIARGIASGAFRADLDPAVAAAMLFGAVDPLVYLRAAEESDPETVREQIISIILAGIRA